MPGFERAGPDVSIDSGTPAKSLISKRPWTPEEDIKLGEAIAKYGAGRWSIIAVNLEGRVGKQCRERWFNHLCPEVLKGEWTAEEDAAIAQGLAELGSKWSEIVKRLPGRTDNAIKNRHHSNRRRDARVTKREEELRNAPPKPEPEPKTAKKQPKGKAARRGHAGTDGPAGKRQRVLDLAAQLGSDDEDDTACDALMFELLDETVDCAAPWGWHASMGTEEPHLDLEQGLEEYFSESSSSSGLSSSGDESERDELLSECSWGSASPGCESPGSECSQRSQRFGTHDRQLSLDLSVCTRSAEIMDMHMLTGDVLLTIDGAVPITPVPLSGLGQAAAAPWSAAELAADESSSDDDWLALYSPGAKPGSPIEPAFEPLALAPLLTPSNTKLCAALVDVFLPLPKSVGGAVAGC